MKLNLHLLGILTLFFALALGTTVVEAQSTTSSTGGMPYFMFFFWADPPEVGVTNPASTVTLRWYVSLSDQISCTASGFTATITPNSSLTQGSAVVTPPNNTSATYRITCTDSQGTYSKSITMQQNPNFLEQIMPTPDYSQIPLQLGSIPGLYNIPGFDWPIFPAVQATGPEIHSTVREGDINGQANGTGPAYVVSYTIPDLGSCADDALAAGLPEDSTYYCLEDQEIHPPSSPVCYMFCTGGQTGGGPPPSWSGGSLYGTYKVTRYFYEMAPQVISWTYPADPAYASATCSPASGSTSCTIYRHLPQQTPPPLVLPRVTLTANPISVTAGNASSLTWSSTNATSCTGTGFSTGGATSGTVSTGALSVTTNYSVSCVGAGGTATDSEIVNVTQTPESQPDLAAGAVTPSSAVRNQAASLSAQITNIGAGAAAASTASLWIRNDAGTVVHSANISTATIAPAGSTGVSSSYTFTAAGTYSARICADTNTSWTGTLAETNESNNCGPWTDIVVTNTPQPDLVASAISPSSAEKDNAVTLSSTIQNQGATATGGSFTNLFQIDNDSNHNSIVTTRTDSSPNLTPSGTDTSQVSYTFGTVGDWYVRACADNDAAWAGSVTESNEGNNCGEWTTVAVTDPTTPDPSSASVSCTVSSTSVLPGESVTYSANPANGATGPYTWVASDGASVGTGSSASRTFATAGTYAMNVRGSNTSVSYCPNVNVAANWCTTGSAALTITASPARVRSGQASTVTWSASNVIGQNAKCTVRGPGIDWESSVSASPACSASGSATPTIATQSTYVLTCGSATKSVIVNVIPEFEEF